jgi:SnoaL-like domain
MSESPLSAEELTGVRRLLDREAIVDCLLRYTRGLDRHDDELVLSAYHPDAIDDHGVFRGGPQEFVDWANALHSANWTAHQHYATNIAVEIDGDSAHVESYFLVVFRRGDSTAVDLAGARYADRFERRDGDWRIAARAVLIEWNGIAEMNPALFGDGFEWPGRWDRGDLSYERPLELDH